MYIESVDGDGIICWMLVVGFQVQRVESGRDKSV
jgi:hypothetical protein